MGGLFCGWLGVWGVDEWLGGRKRVEGVATTLLFSLWNKRPLTHAMLTEGHQTLRSRFARIIPDVVLIFLRLPKDLL